MDSKIISFALLIAATLNSPVSAGPLTPTGAPVPTMKTLDEVEARTPIHAADLPLTISQPGSYYLVENVDYAGSGDGIKIESSHVTIDLNGFTLKGPGPGSVISSDNGIEANNGTTGTTILNGTITQWPDNGIELDGENCFVKQVAATHNSNYGIAVNSGILAQCRVSFNDESGIIVFNSPAPGQGKVVACIANNNSLAGIYMARAGVVINNSCSGNNIGIRALDTAGIRVENNNITDNAIYGLIVEADTISVKNTASDNGTDFEFLSGSVYGTVVDMTAGGAIPSSTNPWANFSY